MRKHKLKYFKEQYLVMQPNALSLDKWNMQRQSAKAICLQHVHFIVWQSGLMSTLRTKKEAY